MTPEEFLIYKREREHFFEECKKRDQMSDVHPPVEIVSHKKQRLTVPLFIAWCFVLAFIGGNVFVLFWN